MWLTKLEWSSVLVGISPVGCGKPQLTSVFVHFTKSLLLLLLLLLLLHLFSSLFSRTTWVNWHQKDKLFYSGFYWSKRWCGGSGISWTICKSFSTCCRQITTPVPHHSVFTGQIPFLLPNQESQRLKAFWVTKMLLVWRKVTGTCDWTAGYCWLGARSRPRVVGSQMWGGRSEIQLNLTPASLWISLMPGCWITLGFSSYHSSA